MSTRTLTIVFAGGDTENLPGGRFLFVKSATAALDITLRESGAGSQNQLSGVGAGARYKRGGEQPPWRFTDITSASPQTVVIILSDDAEFDVANSVNVAGSVAVQAVPSSSLTDTADASLAANAQSAIAANASRRRITVGVLGTSQEPGRVSQAGGTGRGIEIAPGTQRTFETTAAMFIRNDNTNGTGTALSWYAFEEA